MLSNLSERTLLISGILLLTIAAWYTIGYYHPDEHYQILEFANYKLGNIPASDLPWEFAAQIRPGLQPFLAYCTILGASTLGILNPFVQIFILRLLSGLAALFVYWKWSKWIERELSPLSIQWMRLGWLFFWLMPFLNVRFTSENTSAICFFGGLLLLVQALEKQQNKFDRNLVWAGLLLGLSFFFRYQIAFAGIGLVAWLLVQKKMNLMAWISTFLGVVFALCIGLATDFWLYGTYVFAPYNYFFSNIIEGKAANFGVSPFWWYFTEMPIELLPPLSLVLLFFLAVGIRSRPMHVFTWCAVPFFLAHSMVAHKEARFLFPMALPFFFLATAGWQYLQERYVWKKWMKTTFGIFLWINAIAMVIRLFIPAETRVAYAQFLYQWGNKHPESTVHFVKQAPQKGFPLNLPFYNHPAQRQLSWYTDSKYSNDTTALRSGDLMFFTEVIDPKPIAPPGFQLTEEYNYFPDWIVKIKLNNWQSRTRIWGVYRLEKQGSIR